MGAVRGNSSKNGKRKKKETKHQREVKSEAAARARGSIEPAQSRQRARRRLDTSFESGEQEEKKGNKAEK